MENLLKAGKKIEQEDVNTALYKEILKLDNKLNWSIGIMATIGVSTLVILFSVGGFMFNILSTIVNNLPK